MMNEELRMICNDIRRFLNEKGYKIEINQKVIIIKYVLRGVIFKY